MPDGSEQLYKISAVSRLTGFSPTLLRAWERRYELLDPLRQPSGHRLFTEKDLRVLLKVRDLLDQGRSIGAVAAGGRDSLLAGADPASKSDPVQVAEPDSLTGLRDRLVAAASSLDAGRIEALLDQAFRDFGLRQVLYQVLVPAEQELGRCWLRGGVTIACEHLLTSIFGRRLQSLIEARRAAVAQRPKVLSACLPDEHHELGLLLVVFELVDHGLPVVHLGVSLPFEDLERACLQLAPDYVLLSVTREALLEVHKPGLLELVRRQGQSARFLIGGAGVESLAKELEPSGAECWPAYKGVTELAQHLLEGCTAQAFRR